MSSRSRLVSNRKGVSEIFVNHVQRAQNKDLLHGVTVVREKILSDMTLIEYLGLPLGQEGD